MGFQILFSPTIKSVEEQNQQTSHSWIANYFGSFSKYFSLAQALEIDILNIEIENANKEQYLISMLQQIKQIYMGKLALNVYSEADQEELKDIIDFFTLKIKDQLNNLSTLEKQIKNQSKPTILHDFNFCSGNMDQINELIIFSQFIEKNPQLINGLFLKQILNQNGYCQNLPEGNNNQILQILLHHNYDVDFSKIKESPEIKQITNNNEIPPNNSKQISTENTTNEIENNNNEIPPNNSEQISTEKTTNEIDNQSKTENESIDQSKEPQEKLVKLTNSYNISAIPKNEQEFFQNQFNFAEQIFCNGAELKLPYEVKKENIISQLQQLKQLEIK
eukprot:TRINITY_DN2896_c0_g1_i3.p1 TRINITY_DN2896_c0_g1~~TRINITY_DN2896_c0_g1_i3.p1  ORF type:complete len:334 (-),score=80.42 TRINITY_DN2896_c0_g1_i3:375-1376(-)